MATCESRSDDDDKTFTMTRAEGNTAIYDVSTARQLNSRRRQGTTHTGFSVTDRPAAQG